MARFYFVRHGESEINTRASEIVGGRSNHTPLTERGHAQARRVGTWLATQRIQPESVIVSPAIRTIETSDGILQAYGMAPPKRITDERVQELAQGVMEGQPRHEVWRPETVKALLADPFDFKFDGGESLREVQERMYKSLNDHAERHDVDSDIVVVSHGLAIRALAGVIAHLSHNDIIKNLQTPNCSVTIITGQPGAWQVEVVGQDVTGLGA